jgi:hypothetical protein
MVDQIENTSARASNIPAARNCAFATTCLQPWHFDRDPSHINMPICAGCQLNFSLPGYTSHLRQTRNPQCVAIYQQAFGDIPASDEPDDAHIEASHSNSADCRVPPTFQGDFFGSDYREEDFGYEDDDGDDIGLEDDDEFDYVGQEDEEEAENAELEHGWEPPLSELLADVQPDLMDQDIHTPPRPHARDYTHLETLIEHFPGDLAGTPMPNSQTNSGHERYQANLQDPRNPWAPWTSQIDWEVARWAKLRGPGSTAFSDLLKIEGVSSDLYLFYIIQHYSRFMRPLVFHSGIPRN